MTLNQADLSFEDALASALAGTPPEERWLVPLLCSSDEDAPRLYREADRVRQQRVGDDVHLRALIEFSNYCKRNCSYCGLRHDNRRVDRYRMSIEDIERTALEAEELGYRTVVLQSGEDPWYTRDRMSEIIRRIRARTHMAITLSVGERDYDTYRAWREAGADRCLVRIETTDPALFRALHPDDDLEERKRCIVWLRDLGYQLGSGVMVGLPGQTPQMLARDVIWLHEVGAEMIGVGPFIPHPDTPLRQARGGTVEQTLRLVSVLRLAFPWAHLPATTAMGTLDPNGREKALQAGANVMMPNITPVSHRASYQIYPDKICTTDDAKTCASCVSGRLASIGRTIATDPGHVLRGADRQRAPVCDPPRRRLVVLP
ncbi:MAG: [FeFe] hydrogenase H-cluster radical SAM maturase HydE [Deltaproteobacteria bacterium]|nr:[FeFe] hydrogenase H-cluster radical SAM maturase HydE [Deltaproteobacteria bacterium]